MANKNSSNNSYSLVQGLDLEALLKQKLSNEMEARERESIIIPENLLFSKNKENNFNELYEFIMKQHFFGTFSFRCENSNSELDLNLFRPNRHLFEKIPNRYVFEKILPVYRNKFFKIIKDKDNEEYVILRDDLESVLSNEKGMLSRETEKLILLAKSCGGKIFLKIDPTLLSLIKSMPYNFYFTNNKRNKYSNLYAEFNKYIKNSNNNHLLLKNNKNNKKQNIIKRFKQTQRNNIKELLEQEIRFRIFAIKCGFTNMKHFKNMSDFIHMFFDDDDLFTITQI